jgi:hypothetical protein
MVLMTVSTLVADALVASAEVRMVNPTFALPPARFAHVTQDAPVRTLQHIDNDQPSADATGAQ